MRYLVDGHNLIAQLPDIDLADPDDEAKLVFKLRSFCARTGKKVTVVFDGGIPGGVSTSLSNKSVTAKFASAKKMNADQVLIAEIRRVKNTKAYTLVTSDHEICQSAQSRGIPILTTPAFIALLNQAGTQLAKEIDEKDENPRLSAAEVDEWLAIFTQNPKHKKKRKP